MAEAPGKSGEKDTGTLGKLMRLLDLVAEADEPLRFSDILSRSGEPRGSVHRQLGHLAEEGLIELQPDGTYRPGLRLLMLASRAWSRHEFREIAAPYLSALHEATGETVHLGLLSGDDVVYLDKVESRQAVRMHSQIGRASPIYCTGIGKAALSLLAPEEASRRIAGFTFRRFTPATLSGPEALEEELKVIRRDGHAFDRQEHEPGIHCIAAPIPRLTPGRTETAAALSIAGPAFRISLKQLETWAPELMSAARAIGEAVAARLGPRR